MLFLFHAAGTDVHVDTGGEERLKKAADGRSVGTVYILEPE